MFEAQSNRLVYRHDGETLWIEPWGPDALRVRATRQRTMPPEDWALDEPVPDLPATISLDTNGCGGAAIANGKIVASLSRGGKLTMHRATTSGSALVLEEFARNRLDVRDPKCSALEVLAREFTPLLGSDLYAATLRLESLSRSERLFGMGQYQQSQLDLKGCDLEMAQRNSQASVPFLLSSLGYGLLCECEPFL